MLLPSDGATVNGGTWLDASATNATSVEFRLFGGIYGYAAPVLCTATQTAYGWLCGWNTAAVPNGSYTLVSRGASRRGWKRLQFWRQHHSQEPAADHEHSHPIKGSRRCPARRHA